MYGKFWFDGDFFVRNLDASLELRQYQSLSQSDWHWVEFFSFLDRTVLSLSSLGLFFFFLYQGSFSAFVFSMGKDFSINKELPRVNFVKCASRFLRRLCRPLRGISRRSAQQTFSVQWLLYSDDRFPNEFCFLFHWIRGTPALWTFEKVLRLPNTLLCAPCSLVAQNGLCCWTTRCLKALLPWNFPRDRV